MDAAMAQEANNADGIPVWDLAPSVDGTEVPMVTGTREDDQNASVAAFLVKNGIPQLAGIGVIWPDFLTRGASFGQLDSSIRDALLKVALPQYNPGPNDYNIVNDQLTVTMTRKAVTP